MNKTFCLSLQNLIQTLDINGVNFNFRVSRTEEKLKSLIGGILTIILYALSLAYAVFLLSIS